MKKLFFFAILLVQITFVFAQTKEVNKRGPAGLAGAKASTRQQVPPAKPSNTEHNFKNACYPGLAFTVKNYGYNKDAGFHSWGVMVKNNYDKAVQITYKLIVGGEEPNGNGTLTTYIDPGQSYTNDYGKVSAIVVGNGSDKYKIEVSGVCFAGQDCAKDGYAGCDGTQNLSTASPQNSTVKGATETTGTITIDDVKKAIKLRGDRQKAIFKNYFVQGGYTILSEGNGTLTHPNGDSKPAYIVDFGEFKLHFDADGSVGIYKEGNVFNYKLNGLIKKFNFTGAGYSSGSNGGPAWSDSIFF